MKSALTACSICHDYGAENVLEDVSFSIEAGSFFIIIGPNGSGKTTLMKMLDDIEHPKSGVVKVFGRPAGSFKRTELARQIAFVPQKMPVDFPFTVMQVVLMGRAPHLGLLGIEGQKDIEAAHSAMAFTGVENLADRRINQLSSGEQQRVFIARAVCQNPKIILLDEPTASLDPAHQVKVMDIMEEFKQRHGVTVVMVSHDLNLAALYGDRLLLLKDGRIAAEGPPAAVLTFETLEKTYGCILLVDESPLGEVPRVSVVPGRFLEQK
ncbi:MAG TPA: ABC transporter ATP-binding protein [Desulfobacteraceae bacterium]|nr:ABC transporter ATP-binding protein [Desulfobacteraceae bacterium]